MRLIPIRLVLAMLLIASFRGIAQEPLLSRLKPATRSHSGQFVIRGEAEAGLISPVSAGSSGRMPVLTRIQPSGAGDEVVLTPSLVSVSCERIKRDVLRLLRLQDGYRGRVMIYIVPRFPADRQLTIQSTPFSDGWQYSVTVPEKIAWTRFVRTIVEAVLIEIANRPIPDNLVVPPLWFSEGVTTLLLGESGRELVPELNREFKDPKRSINPLGFAQQKISGSPPLSFERLSFPTEADISSDASFSIFQGSSAIFLHELIGSSGAANPAGQFLANLTGSLNWQKVLLDCLQPRFQSALEIEKWWAVQSASRILRDPSKLWSKEAAQAHLASILMETTSAAVGTNAPAGRQNQRLSEIVLGLPFDAQTEVLDRKIAQLKNLFLLAPADMIDVVRDCHDLLQEYRKARATAPTIEKRGVLDPRAALLAKTVSRKLSVIENSVLGPR